MRTDLWKQIEQVLEYWGEWVSQSVNSGYPSKNPICEIMEYGVRTGRSIDICPHYDIDQKNQATHRALLSVEIIDPRLFAIAYYESAWHHESDTKTPRGRVKLKTSEILKRMKISKKTYYTLKSNLYMYITAKLDT